MTLPDVTGWRKPTVPTVQCKGTRFETCIVGIPYDKPSGRCHGCERQVARYPGFGS